MTARANSLTEGVTRPVSIGDDRWTMPESDVRTVIAGLGRLGYDTTSLLTSVALSDSGPGDPDARLGYSEPAPFHRAFSRWYGMTPESFRQKRVRDNGR